MQQPKHEGGHSRKQFQIDRLAFFSDAVIAIAITLMVLEIKIPAIPDKPLNELLAMYSDGFMLHAGALCVCFATIGNLWIKHHDLYEHIVDYNKALIKRNLYFLLAVVLLPVSISFMFSEGSPARIKLFLFFLNLSVCNFFYFFMLQVIHHTNNNFSSLQDTKLINKNKRSTLLLAVLFIVAGVLALNRSELFYVPLFAVPVVNILRRVYTFITGLVARPK